jgi:hypothetical protein
MKPTDVEAIIGAVTAWALKREDVRALALAGSWARGAAREDSDLDLLSLSERAPDYRRRGDWLADIDFAGAGFRVLTGQGSRYGVAWSRHVRLLPAAEVGLTFAPCSWARTDPIDAGTRSVVTNGFRPILDKDRIFAALADAISPTSRP